MLSGRRKKDYEAQQAADSLVAQAEALGEAPPTRADRRGGVRARLVRTMTTTTSRRGDAEAGRLISRIAIRGGGASPSAPSPPCLAERAQTNSKKETARIA